MSSAEFPAPVPIFPLPAVQLFPHALLPLHVFEPRYRELVRDALGGAGLLALPMLEAGYEPHYHERPPVRLVCGVGRIVAHEALPDGRFNILLRGLSRARIVEELPAVRSYRLVRVVTLGDDYPVHFDGREAARTLTLLSEEVAARLPSGGETLRALAHSQSEAGPLADVLAATLVTDPGLRQELLESVDVAFRAERLTTELGALLSRFTNPERKPN